MPNIEIAEGEAVTISFAGTDGQITVAFVSERGECRGAASTDVAAELSAKGAGIFVHADMPDALSRDGVVYHEPFSRPLEGVGKVERSEHDPDAHGGRYVEPR